MERSFCHKIKFVRGENQPCTVFFKELLLEALDNVDSLPCRFFIKKGKGVKSLSELCKTNGNDSNAVYIWHKAAKVGKRSSKLVAVVKSRAKNYLAVHGNACVSHLTEKCYLLTRKAVVHHQAAQLGICCMDRNIDIELHLNNSVNILLHKICKGDIVSLQKGKSSVIVLEIKGLAHIRGHLVDKAEHAFIAAAQLFIHQERFKFKPQIVIFVLREFENNVLIPSFKGKRHHAFRRIIHIIKHIGNFMSVYGYKNVSRLYAVMPGR